MRRISKPWPPANASPRRPDDLHHGQVQAGLPGCASGGAGQDSFPRDQFDQLEKAKLREVMYREQPSISIYCERAIQEGHPPPRIEHWKPLSTNHDQALCWKNLYLS